MLMKLLVGYDHIPRVFHMIHLRTFTIIAVEIISISSVQAESDIKSISQYNELMMIKIHFRYSFNPVIYSK